MNKRDDLKGIAEWDDHLSAWKPLHGHQDAVAAALGAGWTWDAYYGAFFANETEKSADSDVLNAGWKCYTLNPDGTLVPVAPLQERGEIGRQQRAALEKRREWLLASARLAAGEVPDHLRDDGVWLPPKDEASTTVEVHQALIVQSSGEKASLVLGLAGTWETMQTMRDRLLALVDEANRRD